jgi:hypothetical protein
MSHVTAPYLALVIASRNDEYAGGMLRRLQVCLDQFIHQSERRGLAAEVIVVDWNPPPARTLSADLRWPAKRRHCAIRVITVPPEVHRRVPFSERLPITIARARNVGIRRARAQFLLPTSPDILLSDALVDQIAAGVLDPAAMYRIARHDVPEAVLDIADSDARLRYCAEHVIQVHDRGKSYSVPGLPPLFTNGAGDFTLLSREMYWRLRGTPEERRFHSMHFDSVFCFQAHAAGARESVFSDPCRIYHVDHGVPSWRKEPSALERFVRRLPFERKTSKRLVKAVRRVAPPRSGMDRRGVPYLDLSTLAGRQQYEELVRSIVEANGTYQLNDDDWGLGGETLPERVVPE